MSDPNPNHISEQTFRESEEKFRILFENTPIAFNLIDLSKIKLYIEKLDLDTDLETYLNTNLDEITKLYDLHHVTSYNTSYLNLFEIDPNNKYRRSGTEALEEEGIQSWKYFLTKWHSGENIVEYESTIKTYSGSIKKVLHIRSVVPDHNNSRTMILGNMVDITEIRLAEEALQISETKYRNLAELSQSLIWRCDPEGNFTYLNPAWEKVLGYGLDEMVGKEFTDFKDQNTAMESKKAFLSVLKHRTELIGYETQYIHKNGDVVTLLFNAIPLIRSTDEVIGTQGTAVDITARLKAEKELQSTREQLFQAQKMEAVGRLAGGIAHDFNNMLTLITLNAEMLTSQISMDDIRHSSLQNILDAVTSATTLTSELLLFSRNRKMKPKIVNVNNILKKHLSAFGSLVGNNIKQVINLDSVAGNIYIDPNHLEQVILNLIINAVDAMPQGGTLTIETEYVPENYVIFEGQYNTQQLVEISVKDTGIGMTEEVRKRMFEPFFTTKEEGKGTGFGLSIIYHIIQQSNGFIKVDSEVSMGTSIYLYLPKMDPLDLQDQSEFERTSETTDHSNQILLIDDDEKIRSIIKDILTMGGFEVLDASNAYNALRIFEEKKENINLVISDIVMPDLHGQDLVNQILQIKPTVKVLYITGATNKFESISSTLDKNTDILLKPFDSDTLINTLRKLMDK